MDNARRIRPVDGGGHRPAEQRLDDIDNDAAAILRRLPEVAQVTRHGLEDSPSHRIVHLLDWHFVPKDMYSADLRSLSDKPISEEDIEQAWKKQAKPEQGE